MNLRTRGLAVALATGIAAPLVLTATSAFATPSLSTTAPLANDLDYHWGRLVLEDTVDHTYVGLGDDLKGDREKTLYDAEAEAGFFSLPKLSKTTDISNIATGEQLKADAALPGGVGYAAGTISGAAFNFQVAADGSVTTGDGKYLGYDDQTKRLTTLNTPRYHFAGSATTDEVSLVAKLDSFDKVKGTAQLSGTATSGFLDDVRIVHGSTFGTTQPDGSWVVLVSGLKATDTSITLVQTVNGTKYDEHTVPLDDGGTVTPPTPVDTVLTSPTQADADAGDIKPGKIHFSGTATPFSHVSLLLYPFGGREVAKADTDKNGMWEADGDLGSGVYTLGIVQTLQDNTERRSQSFPISTLPKASYQKLTNVRPIADDVIRAGTSPVPFFGNGTPGAQVQIYNGPKDATTWTPRALCGKPAVVDANGHWYCQGLVASNSTYTLYTYQQKGADADDVMNTVKTSTGTIAAEASSANKGGGQVVFQGKATPKSTVEFYISPKGTPGSRVVASATTDELGHFVSNVGWLSPGAPYTLSVYQTVDNKELPATTYKVTTN